MSHWDLHTPDLAYLDPATIRTSAITQDLALAEEIDRLLNAHDESVLHETRRGSIDDDRPSTSSHSGMLHVYLGSKAAATTSTATGPAPLLHPRPPSPVAGGAPFSHQQPSLSQASFHGRKHQQPPSRRLHAPSRFSSDYCSSELVSCCTSVTSVGEALVVPPSPLELTDVAPEPTTLEAAPEPTAAVAPGFTTVAAASMEARLALRAWVALPVAAATASGLPSPPPPAPPPSQQCLSLLETEPASLPHPAEGPTRTLVHLWVPEPPSQQNLSQQSRQQLLFQAVTGPADGGGGGGGRLGGRMETVGGGGGGDGFQISHWHAQPSEGQDELSFCEVACKLKVQPGQFVTAIVVSA